MEEPEIEWNSLSSEIEVVFRETEISFVNV